MVATKAKKQCKALKAFSYSNKNVCIDEVEQKITEREINQLDDVLTKPSTDESLYWLNQAVDKFVKTRFNGDAPHFTSYE